MKKVVYLHGLETEQGGDKVSYLSENNCVWAPKMDYSNPELFKKTLKSILDFEPDVIIGSSMGGYFGFMLASHIKGVKTILFNPALFEKPSTDDPETYGDFGVSGTFILSENDKEVNPKDTETRVKRNKRIKIEIIKNGEHRIPYVKFVQYMEKLL